MENKEIWKDVIGFEGIYQRNILQVASKTEYKPNLHRKQAGGFKWNFL